MVKAKKQLHTRRWFSVECFAFNNNTMWLFFNISGCKKLSEYINVSRYKNISEYKKVSECENVSKYKNVSEYENVSRYKTSLRI